MATNGGRGIGVKMNILTAINKKYMPYFAAMIRSLTAYNGGGHVVYIATKEVTDADVEEYVKAGKLPAENTYLPVAFDDEILKGAPTEKRWPVEIYYRIFAATFLPEGVDRILYLDSDIIVKGDLSALYSMHLGNNFFAATTNVQSPLLKYFLRVKNGAKKGSVYANTGVLLMNIAALKREQNIAEVLEYIARKKRALMLPDQDVIFALYGTRVALLDNKVYNVCDRLIQKHNRTHRQKINEKWVEENVKIIHYLSRNKPWKETYRGILKPWYDRFKVE